MSEINFPDPQSYDAESFSTTLPSVEPKRGGGNRVWLIACGGCTALALLACICCVAVMYFVGRQDIGQASFWAVGFQQQNYDFADLLVCENSQAEELTSELADANAVLLDYSYTQSSDSDVRIDGTMEIEGQQEFWSATFIIADGGNFGGGLFGRCIEEIQVEEIAEDE